jgi:Cu+-exporting ATPase
MKKTSTSLVILGMHCSNCAKTIEDGLKKQKGIINAKINFASQIGFIEFDANILDLNKIIQKIRSLGYDAINKSEDIHFIEQQKANELKKLKKDFFISALFTIPIVLISMPFKWFGVFVPYEKFILLFLSSIIQFYCARRFYTGAFFALKNRTFNMDSLIVLGTSAAFFYSFFAVFFPEVLGDHLYFETSSVIITFVLLGKVLESSSKNKASEAIKKLLGLQPKTATIIKNSKEIQIPIGELKLGDIVIVKPDEKIPTDGIVLSKLAYVDESMLTGESKYVKKQKLDPVFGGTINKEGILKFKVTALGKDTLLHQIIRLVEKAQLSKPNIQLLADSVSSIFVPFVLFLSIFSFIFWYFIASKSLIFSLMIAISILIISCPCALGLATPTAILVGSLKGANMGILIKDMQALENMEKVDTIVFDKTGTLTKGSLKLTKLISLNKFNPTKALFFGAIAEKYSSHPLAKAILQKAKEQKLLVPSPSKFKSIPGVGAKAKYKNNLIEIGSKDILTKKFFNIKKMIEDLEKKEAKTISVLLVNKKPQALFVFEDELNDFAKEVVDSLKKMNKDLIILSGDNKKATSLLAQKLNINNYFSEVSPAQKQEIISFLQQKGKKVLMVGDGINDAPALASSFVSIAMGKGTDVAIQTGQIVLIKNDLRAIPKTIELSNYIFKKIKQNLFWAFFYNILAIPIAAGVFYESGILLNPMIASISMAFSSVFVVFNSLSINSFKPKSFS